MTRSHALLHCPNATLAAARVEAWEGRNPGGIRVLLSNPRWESRLLRFLELSGVGGRGRRGRGPRNQDGRLDCVGDGGDGRTWPVTFSSSLPRVNFSITCKGDLYPENGAQHRLGVEDFVCLG
jgi:hypothetical protein